MPLILDRLSINKQFLLISQVETFRQAWKSGMLFSDWPKDGIVVKINSRKLQLIREKSNEIYPHWAIAIKY